MYKHIMVPLDGSELAECVLPQVKMITKQCEAPPLLTLIRVITPLKLYGGFELAVCRNISVRNRFNIWKTTARKPLRFT